MNINQLTALARIAWPTVFSTYAAWTIVPPLARITAELSPALAAVIVIAAVLQVGHSLLSALAHFAPH